ncbi:protein COFACTOR ASSEMBLY OF COMPLEX C SUBUNIT B CCB2, chloroplastic isoform X2 [Phoenix dactylifera]|uniref:Protein COFACTOR ASSEMBLY OF COMPLEX C SUBUNIT B CCB2, chloroplastic isoform X2 n=1 Tax=Phoenix dactylifera TaxID=42345 RepID=A0A8B9AH17_PHODC|nr:protein COFACTOR ASSEMBLY OF COMPLEX C SUBUNIT B CCB2, chloroplastic isoform X2 [Phoenix dactylifera]
MPSLSRASHVSAESSTRGESAREMERGCGTILGGSIPLLQPRRKGANSLFPRSSSRRAQNRRRFAGVRAQDRNSQQQQLNLSVLRFTLGIPGLDESYLPRYIGLGFGSLILLNHFFSSSSSNVTSAQLRSEALGICLAAFSTALPYLGKFLKSATPVDRSSLPEGNKQIFVMSENASVTQKEDLAWASYVLLRNTNTMSVLIAVGDVLCVRGYWNMTEDLSKAHIVEWFKSQIQQTGFHDLEDTLYFPQKPDSDSQLGRMLPKGTLSLLVQPVLSTSTPTINVTKKTEGFVLLVSSADYAYGDKDRAWIRAVANKFQGT